MRLPDKVRECNPKVPNPHILSLSLIFPKELLISFTGSVVFTLSLLVVQDVLRDTEDHDLGMALSHFFNCFFGSCQVLATKAASNTQSRTPKKVCSMQILVSG